MATAGSAVGLGNIWRFPYVTGHNGGAAFILIYFLCVILLGIPGMVSEFIVGRHGAANAARAYRQFGRGKAWGTVGLIGVLTSMIILGFYSVVAGWCLQYLYAAAAGQISGDAQYVTTYFQQFSAHPVKPVLWAVAFVLITHFVVTRGVRRGIEKASNLLMPTLFFLLIVIVTLFYFFRRYQEFERTVFVILTSFFLYYVVFIFLPVTGPQYYYLAVGLDNISQGVFPPVGDYFLTHDEMMEMPGWKDGVFYQFMLHAHSAGERPTAAFPSSHVGVTLIMLLLAWRSGSRLLTGFVLPFFLLMCLSTVYIRAHYAIDVLAGILSGTVIYLGLQTYWRLSIAPKARR